MFNLPTAYFGKIKDGDAIVADAIRVDPTTVSQGIRDLFLCTCVASDAKFNTHPVILMAINFMQRQEDYSWNYPTGMFSSHTKSARNILFPGLNMSSSPSSFTIDSLTTGHFKDGGVALTVKAFYNGMRDYDDNTNTDKVNSSVAALNTYVNSNATALFAEYYRLHCIALSPSPDLVKQYLSLLLSVPYRQMKLAEFTDGGWVNPPLEMYNHLVKLKACGATDEQVANAINQLTGTAPAIPTGAMSGLTPQAWKSYRGWLFSGYLDWGDIHAQNLGESVMYVPPPPPGGGFSFPLTIYFCPDYLRHYDYWKSSSSSCFAPGAKVVMAESTGTATTTKPIEQIVVGDVVQSRRFASSSAAESGQAKVTFVSSVARAKRTLYSLPEAPDVVFTATHPLVRRNADGNNTLPLPELGFVAMDDACSLNPTWHSIPTRVLHEAKESPVKDEILYDLVLEASVEPISYLLRSDQTGHIVEALSEAPHMAWFPHAVCFLAGTLDGCCNGVQHPDVEVALEVFLKALENDKLRLAVLLETAAREAWKQLLAPTAPVERARLMKKPSQITLDSLLDAGRSNNAQLKGTANPRQLRADVLEGCVGKLGRLINDKIHLGWAVAGGSLDPAEAIQREPYLLVHTLTYLSLGTRSQEPTHGHLRLVVKGTAADGDANNTPVVADVTLPVQREGWMAFEVQRALPLRLPFLLPPPQVPVPAPAIDRGTDTRISTGPESTDSSAPIGRSLDLTFEFEDPDAAGQDSRQAVVFFGGGPLVEQVSSIVGLGARGEASGVYAVVKVQWCLLSPAEVDRWQERGGWNDNVKMAFADELGREFAAQVWKAPATRASE